MDENGLGRYLDLLKESNSPIKSIASKNKINNIVDEFRLNNSWETSKTLNKLVNIDTWLRSFQDKPKVIIQAKKWNQEKIQTLLKKTYDLEIEIKSNSLSNKNILIRKLLVDVCELANS